MFPGALILTIHRRLTLVLATNIVKLVIYNVELVIYSVDYRSAVTNW